MLVGSYLLCLGRFRGFRCLVLLAAGVLPSVFRTFSGQEGVLLESYLRCLGRSRGENGVLVGSYLRCLGRFRGFRCLTLLAAIGGDWARYGVIGRDWGPPPPHMPLRARVLNHLNVSLNSYTPWYPTGRRIYNI